MEYADELVIRQDELRWDRIRISPVADGIPGKEMRLAFKNRDQLRNRTPGYPPVNVEYTVTDHEKARSASVQKYHEDMRTRRVFVFMALALILGCAAIIWGFMTVEF